MDKASLDQSSPAKSNTEKGVRGFELDIHVAFARPLPEGDALRALLALDGFRVDLYRPHASALHAGRGGVLEGAGVPSARLTGPLREPDAVRAGLAALLQGEARYAEVGVRGFLRSGSGQTDWMPWRRTQVLGRQDLSRLTFEEGVRFVLE